MLVPMRAILAAADKYRYGQGAFNMNSVGQIEAAVRIHELLHSGAILQGAEASNAFMGGELDFMHGTIEAKKVGAKRIGDAVKRYGENSPVPIALHLDHGKSIESVKACIDGGFTSVMIDASSKPFAENIEITKKVVEYAHDHGVVVEAELGTLAGIEDEVKVAAHEASYTRPEEVEEFVSKTGCDSLAIAIGTSHGAYKFKPEQCTVNEKGILVPPPLRFDVLEEVSKRLPGFPIVLHGSSSVPQDYVKMINDHGGKMPNAIGVPEEQLRQAARLSVCKINIDSDLRLAMTGTIRQFMDEHPDKFDPREYLKPARANIKELVRHKLVDVLGCAGKA